MPESRPGEGTRATSSQIEQLPAHGEWPRGATSDDTALTLLVAHHLADRDGDGDPDAFLAELTEQGKTVIYVTHDPGLAQRASHFIGLLDGRIAESSPDIRLEALA